MKSRRKTIYLLVVGWLLAIALPACAPPTAPLPGTGSQTQAPEGATVTQPVPVSSLANTDWALESFGKPGKGTPLVPGSSITLKFGPDGQASGNAGCNSYGSQYQVVDHTITFTQTVSTLMACTDEKVMQQEQEYFKALQTASKFDYQGDRLTIMYNQDQDSLNFISAASAPQPTAAAPTATPAATQPPSATDTPGTGESVYLDDRSTATGLVLSYFNAINRKEYLRAYSYWRDAALVGPFEQFQQGYEKTESVEVTLGQIGGDAGAGQMYYSVPALLKTKTSDGKVQTYLACYILHLSQPAIQTEPPFDPLGIEKGDAKAVENASAAPDSLANACASLDLPVGNPLNPAPVTNREDISANNYLDDRSDPVMVLSSLFNAVNRKEYARAYSYWEPANDSTQLPPFAQFAEGYADTQSVQLRAGKVTGDAGAGQFYYTVPVVLKAQTTGGATQTFTGCYTLHLSNPGVQATPPFQPLAIRSADIKQVANDANTDSLLSQPCTP